jgi:hypothetical protein
VGNKSIEVKNLKSKMKPETILMTAGRISTKYPDVKWSNLQYIGMPQQLVIQSRDKYNNMITSKQRNVRFSCQILGTQLDQVDSDTVLNQVGYKTKGLYVVNYTLGWTGHYQFNLQLNNRQYSTFYFNNTRFYKCPADQPFLCAESRECVVDYSLCPKHKAYDYIDTQMCAPH